MNNKINTTGILDVKDIDKENFTTHYKLSKMYLNMDMMGQQTSYDSEKPEDRDSEMGKAFSEKIGKQVSIIINKNTGKATYEKIEGEPKNEEEANPLEGIIGSLGSSTDDISVENIFFVIPKGKKPGDSWIDSSSNNKMKEIKTYTYKDTDGTTATIGLFSSMEGSSTMEMQGMQMDISIFAKTEGEIQTNTKTSLVKKRSSVMDLTGSIEVMGQSVPISSKAIVSINYN